jgi:hypothetical protein
MYHQFDATRFWFPTAVRRDNLLNKPYADWGANDKLDIIQQSSFWCGVEEDGTKETNFPKVRQRNSRFIYGFEL